jgi:hypothetical protein
VIDHAFLAESESPLGPPEGGENDPADLQPQRLAQLLGRDQTVPQKQDHEALPCFLLRFARGFKPLGRDPPALDEEVPDAVLEAASRRIRRDDPAAEEGDRDRVLRAFDRQDSRLPLQAEHLEDVGHREGAQRSLKPHATASRRTGETTPRERPRPRERRS